jgi:glycosyltransferase involved in cell wall biosynthesis
MITVLFATYNGSDTLPLMLESLTKIKAPEGGWKLVSVDNASTDDSRDILNSYLDKLPLTVLTENKQGKNSALNTGIQAIEGELVVLTDDDIVADEAWLCELESASKENPSFDIFSGLILPYWKHKPEQWILEWVNQHIVYALTLEGQNEGEILPEMALGPNMAVKKHVFDAGFRFDVSVGPDGSKLYKMGSETSFMKELSSSGFKCFYSASAKVEHIISEVEMDYEWTLRRGIRVGRGQFDINAEHSKVWFGIPRYLYREYTERLLSVIKACLANDKKSIYTKRWEFNQTRGKWLEAKLSANKK